MSSNKTITIDPEMFKIKVDANQRKTRKKKSDDPSNTNYNNKIKFKQTAPNKSVKYNKLLKYIREKQNKNYENLFNKKNGREDETVAVDVSPLPPMSEFQESLRFLNEIREKNTSPPSSLPVTPAQYLPPLAVLPDFKESRRDFQPGNNQAGLHNTTVKKYNSIPSNWGMNLSKNIPQLVDTNVQSYPGDIPFKINPVPKFGVLKNGNLPTYRQYMNSLPHPPPPSGINPFVSSDVNLSTSWPSVNSTEYKINPIPNLDEKESDGGGTDNEVLHRANMVKIVSNENQTGGKPHTSLVYPKKRKTIKRSFRVGRSKYYSKIGVLINNKTIRDECSTKKHLLKQTTLGEIKRFLIKKGLIKVGSTAPNDVLRKMYESVNMICGDIQNHNTDILLHNYFNGDKG